MATKILVVEDEDSIRSFVVVNLKRNGFIAVEASSGEQALEIMKLENDVAMVLLDVMLPGMDGFETCRIAREKYPNLGIIMLTARGQEMDRVEGLTLGADDYMVKPFSPKELIARIFSLLRRMKMPVRRTGDSEMITSGRFMIHLGERKLYYNEKEIDLTPKEFTIMKIFMENPNRAISRDEIINRVWGCNYIGDLKIADVNISRIRKKLEDDGRNPSYIENVWGYGYRWRGEDHDAEH